MFPSLLSSLLSLLPFFLSHVDIDQLDGTPENSPDVFFWLLLEEKKKRGCTSGRGGLIRA